MLIFQNQKLKIIFNIRNHEQNERSTFVNCSKKNASFLNFFEYVLVNKTTAITCVLQVTLSTGIHRKNVLYR